MNDNPIDSRDKDDPESIGRDWKGNGHTFNNICYDYESKTDEFIYTKTLKKYF